MVTGQQLTMEVHCVVVVPKSECSDFKLLVMSGWIITVVKRRICGASFRWNNKISLDLRPVHQQDHIKAKDQIAIKNEYAGLPSTACYSLVLLYRLS